MADTIFQTAGSVTTILGMLNQFNAFCGVTYEEDKNTTLNTKYNLNAGISPVGLPALKYFGIGTNGFVTTGETTIAARQPKATNMDLYTPLPIRCRPENNDLTIAERANYRLRVALTTASGNYWCYYLKKMIFDPNKVEIVQKNTDGTETTYPLNPDHLNPEPPTQSVGGVIDANTNRVFVRVTGICEITGDEIMEAVNVLYGGDLKYARISEFGFYTGEDRPVNANEVVLAPEAAGSGAYEAVYVQLAKHRCTLGTDLSDSGSTLRQLINFEHAACIEV